MRISTRSIASLVLMTTVLAGCNSEQSAPEQVPSESSQLKQNAAPTETTAAVDNKLTELKMVNDMQASDAVLTLKGQVLFQEMEGGFFGFIAEDGKKYTPIGMNKAHLRHGLVIELTGKLLPDMITTTQFGEVIQVQNVVVLDESNALKTSKPDLDPADL